MGFKNIKKAGLKSSKGNHPRLKKYNKQKKNRFLIGSGIQCGDKLALSLVGSIGLEPTTSTMSTWRSDQLS